jgi:hypothetical protein
MMPIHRDHAALTHAPRRAASRPETALHQGMKDLDAPIAAAALRTPRHGLR